ncbi:MAG: RNA polymerase sigma factor [Chloroflexi bacterium]|nr:RNA polymerase sigma factor [Chloroflexota bacterium]
MVPTSDEDLLNAARGGDLSGFNQLVERYQTQVFNLCLRMVGDPQQAEDATQETFFAAYRAIGGYRGGSFRGFLMRIAANQCYDALRSRRRRPVEPLDAETPLADTDRGPEAAAISAETMAAIEQALLQLPAEQRLCVLLVDVHGLDYQEAGQAMKANLGTVKSRLSRARASLRELLPADMRLNRGE